MNSWIFEGLLFAKMDKILLIGKSTCFSIKILSWLVIFSADPRFSCHNITQWAFPSWSVPLPVIFDPGNPLNLTSGKIPGTSPVRPWVFSSGKHRLRSGGLIFEVGSHFWAREPPLKIVFQPQRVPNTVFGCFLSLGVSVWADSFWNESEISCPKFRHPRKGIGKKIIRAGIKFPSWN